MNRCNQAPLFDIALEFNHLKSQGYQWNTNASFHDEPPYDPESICSQLEADSWDVQQHPIAYDILGHTIPEHVSIWRRKPQ